MNRLKIKEIIFMLALTALVTFFSILFLHILTPQT